MTSDFDTLPAFRGQECPLHTFVEVNYAAF